MSGGETTFFENVVITRFSWTAALQDAELGRSCEKKRPIPLSLTTYVLINKLLNRNNPVDAPYRVAILMAYFFLTKYIFLSTFTKRKQTPTQSVPVTSNSY
jgi:hypothetical protein